MTDLSPDNERFLDDAVASGRFPTKAHALDEAIRLLRARDKLCADVSDGIQQADRGELLPADEVFSRLERRAGEIEKSAQDNQ